MATTLPLDLISDILSCLPAKHIIRFKCISKSLSSLIESSAFIRQHLHRTLNSSSSSSNHLLVICQEFYGLSVLPLDSTLQNRPIKIKDPPVRPSCPTLDQYIVGSCHGLLCLFNCENRFTLYNPTTRTRYSFPLCPANYPADDDADGSPVQVMIVAGFGYDAKTDDYKLVVLCQDRGINDSRGIWSRVYVCGVREGNGWRRIGNLRYALFNEGNELEGAFVNGGLHWITARDLVSDVYDSLLRFDLADERFSLMELPDDFKKGETEKLGVLGGCLRLKRNFGDISETWVMKEYGVKESWTKLITHPGETLVRPIAYTRDMSEVLFELWCSQLSWYNLKMNTSWDLNIEGIKGVFSSCECLESLILL